MTGAASPVGPVGAAGHARDALAGLRVAVVDDEPDLRRGLCRLLGGAGADAVGYASGEEALAGLAAAPAAIVLTDVRMPGMSGPELLEAVLARWPRTVVVVMTGYATVELAVACLQRGAAHFLQKPFDRDEVLTIVERLGRQRLAARAHADGAGTDGRGGAFVAEDPRMLAVLELIEQVAPSPLPVLIVGASGTGKEMVARRVHDRSAVRKRPFLAINTAALPDNLLESELFGHKRGAFTGADKDQVGLFEQARGGTVFLDEIASMSLAFQAKLLRVLQEKVVRPLGAARDVAVSFRLVTASNQDLGRLVAEGSFREDLYYRLRVVEVQLPELKQRVGDIPALAALFLERAAESCLPADALPPALSPAALDVLCAHPWPGNVRELENAIQRAVVVCRGPRILPHHLGLGGASAHLQDGSTGEGTYEDAKRTVLDRFQRAFIERALERTRGNVSRAAETCGLTRAAFQKIMRAHAIDRAAFEG